MYRDVNWYVSANYNITFEWWEFGMWSGLLIIVMEQSGVKRIFIKFSKWYVQPEKTFVHQNMADFSIALKLNEVRQINIFKVEGGKAKKSIEAEHRR